jgi:hypothetical protein
VAALTDKVPLDKVPAALLAAGFVQGPSADKCLNDCIWWVQHPAITHLYILKYINWGKKKEEEEEE